jgi:hypothetical protein
MIFHTTTNQIIAGAMGEEEQEKTGAFDRFGAGRVGRGENIQ